MSILDKLLGRHKASPAAAVIDVPCPHTTLVPHWDSLADMGKEDKVSRFTCDSCGEAFSAEQGHLLRQTEAERLRPKSQD
jgi:transposase-like protein